jgi:hypothetical protein
VYRHIRKDVYKYIEKNVVDCVCVAVGFGPEVGIYMVIRALERNDDRSIKLSVKTTNRLANEIVRRRQGGEAKLAVSQRRSKKWRG